MDYSALATMPLLLERSGLDQSWGFRLQGGADFRSGLSVKKVTANSPAHNKIYPGDGLVFIEGRDTSKMSHSEAEELIRNSFRGQYNFIRPVRPAVRFTQPGHNMVPALNNQPNNYRRH
ncbi:unnamed protein product [Didymodactylos carnosus]|nr:unnamed protein product [Didymodactylos carnosus]CAF3696283.1 unnamed protein product [Didymodactylos carnosus]